MRNYKYDNLKTIMMFCVIFGHCLELIEGEISRKMYILIYTFHMPVFVFITGYLAKSNKEKIFKYIKIYLIWQTIYCLYDKYFLNIECFIRYLIPNRFMWYIMAMIIWFWGLKLFDIEEEKIAKVLLIYSFVFSIVCGFFDELGYMFSMSRIITFLPYFIFGYYSKKFKWNIETLKNNKRNIIIFSIILAISITYFLLIIDNLNPLWLYGSYSYENGNYSFIFKIMWILLSICELFIFLSIIPNKKINIISTVGTTTLCTYLLHGFIIKIFEFKVVIFNFSEYINIILALVISIIILILFGIFLPNVLLKIKNKQIIIID